MSACKVTRVYRRACAYAALPAMYVYVISTGTVPVVVHSWYVRLAYTLYSVPLASPLSI